MTTMGSSRERPVRRRSRSVRDPVPGRRHGWSDACGDSDGGVTVVDECGCCAVQVRCNDRCLSDRRVRRAARRTRGRPRLSDVRRRTDSPTTRNLGRRLARGASRHRRKDARHVNRDRAGSSDAVHVHVLPSAGRLRAHHKVDVGRLRRPRRSALSQRASAATSSRANAAAAFTWASPLPVCATAVPRSPRRWPPMEETQSVDDRW